MAILGLVLALLALATPAAAAPYTWQADIAWLIRWVDVEGGPSFALEGSAHRKGAGEAFEDCLIAGGWEFSFGSVDEPVAIGLFDGVRPDLPDDFFLAPPGVSVIRASGTIGEPIFFRLDLGFGADVPSTRYIDTFQYRVAGFAEPAQVPEPTVLVLLAAGAAGLGAVGKVGQRVRFSAEGLMVPGRWRNRRRRGRIVGLSRRPGIVYVVWDGLPWRQPYKVTDLATTTRRPYPRKWDPAYLESLARV